MITIEHQWEVMCDLLNSVINARFIYTDFLTSAYGSHKSVKKVHGLCDLVTFYDRFKSVTCYLRFITSYYDVLTVILNDLL